MNVEKPLNLHREELAALQRMASHQGGHSREARRARIILLVAEGRATGEICAELGCSHQTVGAWRRRFQQHRLAGVPRPRHRLGGQ